MVTSLENACPWWKKPITWIFLLGLIARLVSSLLLSHTMYWKNDIRMTTPAIRLLEGKGLSLEDGAGPTAYRPPLYVLWISGMYAIFGVRAELGPSVIQSLVSAGSILILYMLTRALTRDERASNAAALILAIHPYTIYHDAALYHTFLNTILLLGAFFLLYTGYKHERWWYFTLSGICFTLSIYLSSVIVPFLALLIVVGVGVWNIPFAKRIALVGAFLVGLIGMWTPWVIRNAIAFHAFIPLTTESGVTLWMGNNPEAKERLRLRTHEASPVPEGTRFAIPRFYEGCIPLEHCTGGVSEVQESKELTALATNWIKAHPGEFAQLTLWRYKGIWSPFLTPAKSFSSNALINALITYGYATWNILLYTAIAIGTITLWRKREYFYPLMSIGLALSATAAYALFLYFTKYRIPYEAVLLPLAGIGAVEALKFLQHHWKRVTG